MSRRILQPIRTMKTWGVTRSGYPQNTIYFLLCGHSRRTARPERAHLHLFLLDRMFKGEITGPVRIKCYECSIAADKRDRAKGGG